MYKKASFIYRFVQHDEKLTSRSSKVLFQNPPMVRACRKLFPLVSSRYTIRYDLLFSLMENCNLLLRSSNLFSQESKY